VAAAWPAWRSRARAARSLQSASLVAIAASRRRSACGPHRRRNPDRVRPLQVALYRLYNKELRRDPTLKGQVILKLTIEPDGTVSLCELKSST
jgi:hypothetical protein